MHAWTTTFTLGIIFLCLIRFFQPKKSKIYLYSSDPFGVIKHLKVRMVNLVLTKSKYGNPLFFSEKDIKSGMPNMLQSIINWNAIEIQNKTNTSKKNRYIKVAYILLDCNLQELVMHVKYSIGR